MKKNLIFEAKRSVMVLSAEQRSFRMPVFLCALFFGIFVTGTLSAQYRQYREDPVDENLSRQKSDLGSGDEAKITAFAKGYYLARWTQRSNLSKLHEFRRDTATDVAALRSENKKTCQRVLVGLFAEMAQAEDLLPAVRYNAALALGMFNEREPGVGGAGDAGVPYAPAIGVMANIFDAAETDPKGSKVPDYVILAILINSGRYAALGLSDPADHRAVVDIFLKTLDPAFGKKHGYSAETTTWFQKKAVDGLAAFASPSSGENDTIVLDTFIRLLRDKSIDYTVQCAALRGIGGMNFDGKADFDFEPVVGAIAWAALLMNQKEIAFIDEENIRFQVESSQGVPGRGTGMMTPGGGDADTTKNVVSRVKFDAESLRMAVDGGNGKGGVLPLLTKESQTELRAALESLLARIDRTNNYLDFGEDALSEQFDAKKVKRPRPPRGGETYFMVNSMMVKLFLTDETDFYQDLVESLTTTDAETPH